jgi:hypothetical protein
VALIHIDENGAADLKSRPAGAVSQLQKILERETRFELATSTLARSHSTTELLPRALIRFYRLGVSCQVYLISACACDPPPTVIII